MGERTGIKWTHHTFNPWIGCVRVSPGCEHCYAEALVKRTSKFADTWGPEKTTARRRTSRDYWRQPGRWNKACAEGDRRRLVFCGSMCDVFEDHADANAIRPDLWAVMRHTPHLEWQLLTKRPEDIEEFLPDDWGQGYPNVWLGTSIESRRYAYRADLLREIPAAVRFISYEPALEPVGLVLEGIHWVIAGGESGPGHRPMDPHWALMMMHACERAGVAFFYKQDGGPKPSTIARPSMWRQEFPR